MINGIKAELRVNPLIKKTPFNLVNKNEALKVLLVSLLLVLVTATLFIVRLVRERELYSFSFADSNIILSVTLMFWILSFEIISFFIFKNFESEHIEPDFEITTFETNPFGEIAKQTVLLVMPDQEHFFIGSEVNKKFDLNEAAELNQTEQLHASEQNIHASISSIKSKSNN